MRTGTSTQPLPSTPASAPGNLAATLASLARLTTSLGAARVDAMATRFVVAGVRR